MASNGFMDVAIIVSSDNDLCEAARMVHHATMRNGARVSVEAALFTSGRKPILLSHYDYTRQLRFPDFDAARDSFDYSQPIDQVMENAFVVSCTPLRRHFPA